jgi:hypothetical protein
MVDLTKEEVQTIEMDIDSCPVCGGTYKVALFDGECISYEACPDPECVPGEDPAASLADLTDTEFSEVPF